MVKDPEAVVVPGSRYVGSVTQHVLVDPSIVGPTWLRPHNTHSGCNIPECLLSFASDTYSNTQHALHMQCARTYPHSSLALRTVVFVISSGCTIKLVEQGP